MIPVYCDTSRVDLAGIHGRSTELPRMLFQWELAADGTLYVKSDSNDKEVQSTTQISVKNHVMSQAHVASF